MAVTSVGKPGDFLATFSFPNTSTPDVIMYGVLGNGKIYRARSNHDTVGGLGGRGTWVDTGLTIPDVTLTADL